jgi:hypothetical protein
VAFAEDISRTDRKLLYTPETSGGLLIALAAERAADLRGLLPNVAIIGEVTTGDGHIWVEP